jgi:hypothetical protein
MSESFKIEVELPVAGKEQDEYRYVEIEVDCEYSIENDGIGPYEYWGSKEVDRGTDYIVIDNTDWDTTGFTQEEIDLINAEIDKHLDEWATQIGQRLSEDRADYSVYCDGED